jgi:predicted anti-sigma-YlaC factor YlaD
MLNDDHIEELLPRYIEGDLTAVEKRAVDEHLSSCDDCNDALGLYSSLEQALVSFKRERPSPKRTYSKIERRLPLDPVFSPLSLLRSPTVLGSAAVALIAILTILFSEQLGIAITRFTGLSFDSLAGSFETIPEWIVRVTGGNLWMLVLIVAVETMLFSFATGLTVLRMIRD